MHFTSPCFLFVLTSLFSLVAVLPTADHPPDDKSAHYSNLHRRHTMCNDEPGQNLNLQDCRAAVQRMPTGSGIGIPLSNTNPRSPQYLPREFLFQDCRVALDFAPGRTEANVFMQTLRFQARLLVDICVGGVMPGVAHWPVLQGRGGNRTFEGVSISVSRRFDI